MKIPPMEKLDAEFNKMRMQLDYLCNGMAIVLKFLSELQDQSNDSNDQRKPGDDNSNK